MFLEVTVLIKVISLYSLLIYLVVLLTITILLAGFLKKYNICMLWNFITRADRNILPLMIAGYFYFMILSCLVGYLRSFNKETYHKLEVNNEQYFILGKNCNSLILGKSYEKGGKDFYLMPCHYNKGELCHIFRREIIRYK
ncbi:hypothetical protein [Avibacterium paragallinarum]|uniref:hypothetical protein n=1 Tax=Avibacterium paragallinarum TaxID=728 RepID=UPI00188E9BDD|nr:hypothetical protein [Avibacterium paragallinarum]